MVINWEYVKQRTLWNYEELIKKLCRTLSYDFVLAHYNHSMDEAIDYLSALHGNEMQQPEKRAWVEGLAANFAWLKRVGVQNYLDLVQQVESRQKCEAFLKSSGMDFLALIDTLNYLFRWVLPFPTPLREFFNTEDASELRALEALKEHRITTSLDLLEQGRTPGKRSHLVNMSGIAPELLLRLVHQADLSRLPYVRGKTVRHLCGGGYDMVAKLANADLQEMEVTMDAYYHTLGKELADFKSVIPLAPLIHWARILPGIFEV